MTPGFGISAEYNCGKIAVFSRTSRAAIAPVGTEARGLPRRLDLARDLRTRSVFLFGPRQTGKTTWLRQCFPDAPWFNLLHGEVFLRLSRDPGRLRAELAAGDAQAR